jgi:elongation factor Ts
MSISATMVRDLRERTNAGMMDCKKALEETKGDFEAAVEWLRKKGLASAAKKADRLASEGLVTATVANGGKSAVVVEINSETDFVARNEQFKGFISDVAQQLLQAKAQLQDSAQLMDLPFYRSPGVKLGDHLKEIIAKIGENIVIRRFTKWDSTGYLHSYVHGDGKIGVIVELSTSSVNDDLKTFANDICLHVAAMNPLALSPDQVAPEVVSKEKEILRAKNIEQGKKPEMIDKIVEGQIRKFLSESCLLEQAFVKNPDLKVSEYAKEVSKKAGAPVAISRFVRFELGEGLQKKSNNFAEEVAAQAKGH